MRHIHGLTASALLWCSITAAVARQAMAMDTSGATIVDAPIGTKVDDYLSRLSGFGYSGATLIAKDGQVILRKGYGFANDSTRTPVTVTTVFDIGSLAKPFTATAIVMLAERKQLALDDAIAKYLDDVPSDKQAITIRQLLAHESGMASDFPYEQPTGEDYEEVSRDDAVRRILAVPLVNPPGTKWSYSNIGYVLLAAIVERASGQPYRAFLRARLFQPADMVDTGFWGSDLPRVPDESLARSYDEKGETANLRTRSATTWFDQGGGEMVSSVRDLYSWLLALQAGKLISRASLDMMWSADSSGHALGWSIDNVGGFRRIHHGGDYIGFGAELAFFPDEHLVVANLANRRNDVLGTRYAADRVVPLLVAGRKPEMWSGERFDEPPAWSPTLTAQHRATVGTYRLSTGGEFVVTAAGDDALSIAARGQDAIDVLAPASESELRERRRLNEAALAVIDGAGRSDTTAIAANLREGGPVAGYAGAIGSMFKSKEGGKLQRLELIGTVPSAYPRHSSNTMVRFVYERSEDVLRLKWVNGRIEQMGGGRDLLAETPLRASATSSGLVGWNIIWTRAVDVSLQGKGSQVTALELERPGDRPIIAERAEVVE